MVYINIYVFNVFLEEKENMKLRSIWNKAEDGYAALIGGVVAVLVTILVGVLVYYKIAGNMGITGTQAVAAAAQVNTTASTVFTLAPIIGIVMIASIVLMIVTNFGTGPKA